jgi:hypothetical protein
MSETYKGHNLNAVAYNPDKDHWKVRILIVSANQQSAYSRELPNKTFPDEPAALSAGIAYARYIIDQG